MRLLLANLKVFCQWWALVAIWLCCLVFSLAVVFAVVDGERGVVVGTLGVSFVFGIVFGAMQQYMRSRPCAFLLPGHGAVVRRLSFWFSIVMGAVVGISWTFHPHLAPARGLALGLGFLLSASCCLGGIAVGMIVPNVGAFFGFVPLAMMGGNTLAVPEIMRMLVTDHPLLLGLLGIGVSIWAWRVIGRRETARQGVLLPRLFLTEMFDVQKAREHNQQRQARRAFLNVEPATNALAPLCLAGVRSHASTSPARYAYDAVYRLFGFVTWKTLLSFVTMFTLFPVWLSYTRSGFLLYPLVSILIVLAHLSKGSVSLPVGRHERLTSGTLRMAMIICIAVLLTSGITIVGTLLLPFLPVITIKGHRFAPQPLPEWGPLIVLVVQPLAYAVGVWAKKHFGWLPISGAVLGLVGAFLAHKGVALASLHWLLAVGASLAMSLLILRYHFLRRDLV